MNSDRLKILLSYLESDPNDAFTMYAIAMEYFQEAPSKAAKYLNEILEKHSDYLPAYYQMAQLLIAEENFTAAKSILTKGIKLAEKQDNHLTLRELRNALNEVLFDEEND